MISKKQFLLACLFCFPLLSFSAEVLGKTIKTPPEENPCIGVIRRMPIDYRVEDGSTTESIVDYRKDIGDFRGAMWQGAKVIGVEFASMHLPENGWVAIGYLNEKGWSDSQVFEISKGSYKNFTINLKIPIEFREEQYFGMGVGRNATVKGATFLMDLSDWICSKN
jgi:hypothetical protein